MAANLRDFYNGSSAQQPQQSEVSKLHDALWVSSSDQSVEASGGGIHLPEDPAISARSLAEKVIMLGKGVHEITQLLTGAENANDPYREGLGRLVQQHSSK